MFYIKIRVNQFLLKKIEKSQFRVKYKNQKSQIYSIQNKILFKNKRIESLNSDKKIKKTKKI